MVALLNARAPREALRLVHGPDATLAHLLIEHIAAVCNVSASTYDDADQHYGAVGAWLAADEGKLGRYSPEVYAQGATALQTLVRPDASGAYDIDAVCVLRHATGIRRLRVDADGEFIDRWPKGFFAERMPELL